MPKTVGTEGKIVPLPGGFTGVPGGCRPVAEKAKQSPGNGKKLSLSSLDPLVKVC